MKKLIIVLISVILLLALTSCDFNSVFDEIVEDGDYLGLVNTTGLDLTLDLPDKFA